MKSGLALFEIHHTQPTISAIHCKNDWSELVFAIHECKCYENQPYILALRFQNVLLVVDLFVLQELLSQLLPDQRTWRKFHLFPELFDILKKCLLCQKVCLDSTLLVCQNTLAGSLHFLGSEMNWTLSFLWKSDKLVVGQHLLVSPPNAAVKPAYSVSGHRPNPTIQEGSLNALSWITSRRHARSVEEHRFDLYICHFIEILGLLTCRRCRFSQRTERQIRWIGAGKIPVWRWQQ